MNVIYILELENNKYYVGKTKNLEKRLQQHNDGTASHWTNIHKFIRLVQSYPQTSPYEEDAKTIDMMEQYGIDHVRGGIYTQIILGDNEMKHILKTIRGKNNLCYNCGEKHFIISCPNCKRCGRNTHNISNCYASYHNDGYSIQDIPFFISTPLSNTSSSISCPNCKRCGRNTHNINNCYASYHNDGYSIQNKPSSISTPLSNTSSSISTEQSNTSSSISTQLSNTSSSISTQLSITLSPEKNRILNNLEEMINISPIRNIKHIPRFTVEKLLPLCENEIHYYYYNLNYNKTEKYIITSMNFYHIRNDIVIKKIPIKNISEILHIKNGFLNNDQLVFNMTDNTKNIIELYEANVINKLSKLTAIIKLIY